MTSYYEAAIGGALVKRIQMKPLHLQIIAAIFATGLAALALFFTSSEELPKLSNDKNVPTVEEFSSLHFPCRTKLYEKLGDDITEVMGTDTWRKDGYVVIEMQATLPSGNSEWRLCIGDPKSPSDVIIMAEKNRPYWFASDSEVIARPDIFPAAH